MFAMAAQAAPPPEKATQEKPPKTARAVMPLIGDPAPPFEAVTSHGKIKFPQAFQGSWVILFSHPGDFTPVCTTEIMTFAKMQDQFNELNCKLLGMSVDSLFSHIAWMRMIEEEIEYEGIKGQRVGFPIIADVNSEVAEKYGMLHPGASDTHTVRAIFIIDPETKIRAILYYPLTTGRNFAEIKRLLIALQTVDEHQVATPADWQPGDRVIVPPPTSCGIARDISLNPPQEEDVVKWFLTFKELPKEEIKLPSVDKGK
jgi:peroxiredoxin (alkyl hydroperoxide reductase subunit C)